LGGVVSRKVPTPPNLPNEFIMLPNECFALACRAYYDEIGLVVDEKNGEFAHCPLPERYGDKGYYLLHDHHQQQGLLQSKDIGELCFFAADVRKWLLTSEIFPDNYFKLWDTYEEHVNGNGKQSAEKLHAEKDENGKSKHARKCGMATGLKNQRMVELIRISDREVFIFESIKFAAEILGVYASNITSVCQGKRKTVGGYTARYLD
jgi:hypothetical protein